MNTWSVGPATVEGHPWWILGDKLHQCFNLFSNPLEEMGICGSKLLTTFKKDAIEEIKKAAPAIIDAVTDKVKEELPGLVDAAANKIGEALPLAKGVVEAVEKVVDTQLPAIVEAAATKVEEAVPVIVEAVVMKVEEVVKKVDVI